MAGLFNQGFSSWNSLYLYPTVPFGGAFAAVIFTELVWKSTKELLNEHEDGLAE